jgi:U3 small nucleolar RNA-associated protein 11
VHSPKMSTLRNAVQRRNHRERAQPLERQKWGILEKSKDYKLRAADHKTKKRKLKNLQQKAADRNDDEFYFGMVSSQSQGGVKVAKRGEENGSKVLSRDVVGLMKTQDVGYLRTVLQQTRREREKLGREVISCDVGVKPQGGQSAGKRVVFGDDGEQVTVRPLQTAEEDAEDDEWLSEDDEDQSVEDLSPEEQRRRRKQETRRRKLHSLEDQEQDLAIALREVEDQRARMNGTIGGVNKKGVKFKVRSRRR